MASGELVDRSHEHTAKPGKLATLAGLPYDIILLVVQYLQVKDIKALMLCCKALHDAVLTRPVFMSLAMSSLLRCRALPLQNFQSIHDLSNDQLVRAVGRAASLEDSWSKRTPRRSPSYYEYAHPEASPGWYRVLSVPPNEPLEWLSPLTTSYNVFMTKNGRLVCWDQHLDRAVAECNIKKPSLLWKCRLVWESHMAYFVVMILPPRGRSLHDVDEGVVFKLIQLQFPPDDVEEAPSFSHVTSFQIFGHPCNLFLLDTSARLLATFVCLSSSTTIALHVLHDWNEDACTFIDTGIEWSNSATWSCYLHEDEVVIHTEQDGRATEYFYSLDLLRRHIQHGGATGQVIPTLTADVQPSMIKCAGLVPWSYQAPKWYPDSVHYVRQWWPSLPGVSSLCNAVTLVMAEDIQGPLRFVLTQHYFEAGLPGADRASGATPDSLPEQLRKNYPMSYVSIPFAIACTSMRNEQAGDDDEDEESDFTLVPLIATDFGHAVWVEHITLVETLEGDDLNGAAEPVYYSMGRRLRFVSFPPVSSMWTRDYSEELSVRTLETPAELNLNTVNNICLDQSQGTVTMSVTDGRIFVLYYE